MPLSRPGDGGDVTGRAGLREARTLRPGSAIGVGAIGGLACLALLLPAVLSPARSWTLISSVVLVLVLIWVFVVRPCAVLHDEGVRLVNPLRTVDITWPMIHDIRSRWTLELFSDGRKYTAWGIPADPGRPRYGRGIFLVGANRVGRGKGVPQRAQPRPKVEAQSVAAEIEARVAADKRRKVGRTPRIVTRTWEPVPVGLLLASLAFWVIGTFVL
ncbi:MAG: PH domain-containing protein [Intrasporangium sp.]|uniref:PH domain-containing protein n=1 Tax=Intrasporangium sp. TaxID=1925024 RepID=UPI0026474F59|nr:PH domain-containing protein [Intrasporangium sp.]MDN5796692.1 PH domain-containing protein [Intrasporangium sp.]